MGLLKDGYAVMSLGTRQLTEEKPFKKKKSCALSGIMFIESTSIIH